MKAIANIGLVFVIGAGLTISSRMVFGETAGANNEPRRVMRPTLTDAGPSLELASFGVAELTPEGGVAIPVLHVRAVVTNTTGALLGGQLASKYGTAWSVAPGAIANLLPTNTAAAIHTARTSQRMRTMTLPQRYMNRVTAGSFFLGRAVRRPICRDRRGSG
jgi:hypothetical protein